MSQLHFKRENYLDGKESKEYLSILQAVVPWEPFLLSPNSRKVYRYAPPTTFDPLITPLIHKIETDFKTTVRGIFMNIYENGSDYCSYHKDRYNTDVYTISLGETRDLLIKPDVKGTRAEKITLQSGDLYFMDERLHRTHVHSIPKRKNVNGVRISIVFFCTPI